MAQETLTLEEKMALAQTGDNNAYASLLSDITQILRGYLLRRMAGSADIEDVLQEILISVHNARHTYDKSRPFKPWLFSIAKFRLYDHFRKVYRNARNEKGVFDEIANEISENVTDDTDSNEELYEAIETLPKKQKQIIEMMKVEGYTAKEVGEYFNMSESAVKVSAHRTYKTLRREIEKKHGN